MYNNAFLHEANPNGWSVYLIYERLYTITHRVHSFYRIKNSRFGRGAKLQPTNAHVVCVRVLKIFAKLCAMSFSLRFDRPGR